MFIEASAIVAILTREPEADALADTLESARSPITSPVAIFEAALGVCRKRHASIAEGHADVLDFLQTAQVETVPITGKEASAALDAFERHGKDGVIPPSSTWATVSPTPSQKAITLRSCSKVQISKRPMQCPRLAGHHSSGERALGDELRGLTLFPCRLPKVCSEMIQSGRRRGPVGMASFVGVS